jgi:hypothetical protein
MGFSPLYRNAVATAREVDAVGFSGGATVLE